MLAQANDKSAIFVWSLILIGLLLAGSMLVAWLRRRMQGGEEESSSPGFTLADLRQMHRQGQLSDVEFERAKAQLVAGLKRKQDKPPASRE